MSLQYGQCFLEVAVAEGLRELAQGCLKCCKIVLFYDSVPDLFEPGPEIVLADLLTVLFTLGSCGRHYGALLVALLTQEHCYFILNSKRRQKSLTIVTTNIHSLHSSLYFCSLPSTMHYVLLFIYGLFIILIE